MASYKLPNTQVFNIIENKKENNYEALFINTLQQFSKQVRNYRKRNNLTNKQLAQQCGITTSIMARVESGYQNLTLDTICKVAHQIGFRIIFEHEPTAGNNKDRGGI